MTKLKFITSISANKFFEPIISIPACLNCLSDDNFGLSALKTSPK